MRPPSSEFVRNVVRRDLPAAGHVGPLYHDARSTFRYGEQIRITSFDEFVLTRRHSVFGEVADIQAKLIAAPVTGTIVARNEEILRDPVLVNRDSYDTGWLIEIEPAMWEADAAELVSGDDLDGWIADEVARLDAEGPKG